MKEILSDGNTYRKLKRDPTTCTEKTVAEKVKQLHQNGLIPDQLKDQLTPNYSNPPQIYGVQKILTTPYDQLSPQYRLAKELARTLSPLAGKGDSFVKNSTHFARDGHTMEIDDGDLMVSFDVVSLFTRVPIDEALKVIEQ